MAPLPLQIRKVQVTTTQWEIWDPKGNQRAWIEDKGGVKMYTLIEKTKVDIIEEWRDLTPIEKGLIEHRRREDE